MQRDIIMFLLITFKATEKNSDTLYNIHDVYAVNATWL